MKSYMLASYNDVVCDSVTLVQATQICTHFEAHSDSFWIADLDGDVFFWCDARKKFLKELANKPFEQHT